jgi:hypothetical protein
VQSCRKARSCCRPVAACRAASRSTPAPGARGPGSSQPVWAAAAGAVQAILAGAAGDESRAYELAAEAE